MFGLGDPHAPEFNYFPTQGQGPFFLNFRATARLAARGGRMHTVLTARTQDTGQAISDEVQMLRAF